MEIAQLCAAAITFPLLLWALWRAYRAECRRRLTGANGPLVYLSRANLIRGSCRLGKSLLLIWIGVVSVTLPPPSTTAVSFTGDVILTTQTALKEEQRANTLVRRALIAVTILLAFDASAELWYWRRYAQPDPNEDCP